MVEVRATGPFRGGQDVDAPDFNQVSDAISDLAGQNGVTEREGSLRILDGMGGRFIDMPRGTTAQRPSSPAAGYKRFNTTTNRFEWYDGSGWRDQAAGVTIVTYATLDSNGDVGAGANQVSRGNHVH